MKKKYLSAFVLLCVAAVLLSACGADPADGTSDMTDTHVGSVAQDTDKADDVVGSTEADIIPGAPEVTADAGRTEDGAGMDKPATDTTSERATEGTAVTEPPLTSAPDTTPAVRPPEGK